MDEAIWVASIFGPILIVLGLWVLFRTRDVDRFWTSIKATPAVFYIGAMLNLLIGFTILSLYNEWSMHIAVLVTIFGYMQAIRGVLSFLCTESVMKWSQNIMNHPSLRLLGIVPVVYGLLLSWVGFFM